MKITSVTTILIHDPDAMVVQDSTIPPLKPGAKGRDTIFIFIDTDEGTQGFSYLSGPRAVRSIIHDEVSGSLLSENESQN